MKLMSILLLLLLTVQAYAVTCAVYFEDQGTARKQVKALVEKDFADDAFTEPLLKMKKAEAQAFLDVVGTYQYPTFKKAMAALKKNPEHFERFGQFNPNIFIREMGQPGSAKARFQRNSAWSYTGNDYSYRIPEFKAGVAATEKEKNIRSALVSINAFLNTPEKVYARLQDFEDEVMIECIKLDKKYFSKSTGEQYKIREKAMEDVMGRLEAEHGFKSISDDGYKPLILEDKSYSLNEWFEMLRKGHAFNDSGFLSGQGAADLGVYLAEQSSRGGHGYYTHRIQWYAVMKDMDEFPAKYKNLSGSEVFKKLGDMDYNKKMGQANSASDTLWQNLFDSFSGSYHQPEFFRERHGDLPDLGLWL